MQTIIFSIFALIAVTSAVMVVFATNPVRCALSLVLCFVASAGLWILAHAEFLALILILVYVGAVMTLFLFVIMMVDINVAEIKRQFVRYIPLTVLIVGLLVFLLLFSIYPEHFSSTDPNYRLTQTDNTLAIGRVLYTQYAFPFEIAAVLLLVAIISAISLVHRPPQQCRKQDPAKQMSVKKSDRLRVIKMPSKKKDQP